jgi:nucleoside-diphosphate-sugar epimerase
VNLIWQGDANDRALRALEYAANPPAVLNVTGPETLSVERLARGLARAMGKEARFAGQPEGRTYLADAGRANGLFGYPRVPAARLVRWEAEWFNRGGASLGKPTHFEVRNGEF